MSFADILGHIKIILFYINRHISCSSLQNYENDVLYVYELENQMCCFFISDYYCWNVVFICYSCHMAPFQQLAPNESLNGFVVKNLAKCWL